MGTNVVRRLTHLVLAVAVTAALAAGVGPASASPATGSDQLAAWAETASYPVSGTFALAVDPATHTAYFGGTPNGIGLSVLNELTGKITGTLDVGDDIGAATVNPATGTLYVTNEQTVEVVDLSTGKVTTTIPVGMSPGSIAVNPDTDTIFVVNTSTITVIDGSTNTVTTTIDLTDGLSGIAVDPVTNTFYVSNFHSDTVSVIDGATNQVTDTISGVGPFAGRIAVNPVTDKIYVAGADAVTVLDGRTDSVEASVEADATRGIAVGQETNTIYTLSFGSEIGALNGATNQFDAEFAVADDSNSIGGNLAVDPEAGTIYVVTDFDDPGNPDFAAMEAITSCRSHVIVPAGSGCATVAAAFEPAAATFSSPSQGVVMGTTFCVQTCFQAAMMATADGGKHWSFLSPPSDIEIESFQPPSATLLFTSADNGWLFGSFHTANGGVSWQRAVPGAIDSVLAIAASKTTIYEAVQPDLGRGELVATPIGGTRWTRVHGIAGDATGLATSGRSVWLTTSTRLWASADGRVWHSYPARCPGTGYELAGVTATSPSQAALLCARPTGSGQARRKEILISTDGGRTVRLAGPAPSPGVPQAFASPPGDPSVITVAAGGTGKKNQSYWIYRSSDGGKTWTTQTIQGEPGESFRSLSYPSRTTGWIVLGSERPAIANHLLHTTDGGRSWHKATL